VSGLWHGASWTFVIWGALHGAYMIISRLTEKQRNKVAELLYIRGALHTIIKVCITFVLASFAWIFFRANTVDDAFFIVTHLFSGLTLSTQGLGLGVTMYYMIISLLVIGFVGIVHIFQENKSQTFLEFMASKKQGARMAFYLLLLFSILLFGVFENTHFIYFQF
jgi:hypothetical protein